MIDFCRIFIDSMFMWTAAYFSSYFILNEKRAKAFEVVTLIIFFSLMLTFVNFLGKEIVNGVIKILIVYILQCFFIKLSFRQDVSKCIIIALIWYLCLILSEAILVSIVSIILNYIGIAPSVLNNSIPMNVLISLLILIIIYLLKSKVLVFVNNHKSTEKSALWLIMVMLLLLALIGFKRPITNWHFDAELLLTMIVLLCICILCLYLIKQKSDINKTTSMYQQVVKYSNTTNKVLEDYRMISHEHKNQLSIIRQMILKDKNEAIEYIDSLINTKNDIKYKWVAELNKLPLEGLKGLINYKLIEAEEKNIKTSVIISKEVSKVKLNKLSRIQKDHLYSICGVYLDNAIQAASKNKIKEMNIEIYKENKELVFIIANTFSGKIELEKIDDYGYSTKGKNHGVGLHLVKRIIDEDKLYSHSRKIIDNYYAQELRINLKELSKKKK